LTFPFSTSRGRISVHRPVQAAFYTNYTTRGILIYTPNEIIAAAQFRKAIWIQQQTGY
jgi:hypothetical protein